MKYFKKLEGEHIYLSPRNTEDVEKYTQWLNDFDITDYLGRSGSLTTLDSEKEYLEQNSKEMNNKYNFAIVKKENDEMIGGCGIEDINFINRRGTLGIFIGDKASQNHGYGTETIKLLLDYGFNNVRLNLLKDKNEVVDEIKMDKANKDKIKIVLKDELFVVEDVGSDNKDYSYEVELNNFKLPVKVGDVVGKIYVKDGNKKLSSADLTVSEDIKPLSFIELLLYTFKTIVNGNI